MSFASLSDLLQPAQAGGYAVGGFTFTNFETAAAVVEETSAQCSPALLMIGPWELPLLGVAATVAMAELVAAESPVPVCLHLDHATELGMVRQCIEAGFPSVMMDASTHDFETNIRLTREVVQVAHARGVSVEGELGAVGRGDDWAVEGAPESVLTDPARAAEYVERTGIDALAVSIGNGHGIYVRRPELHFELLAAIRAAVSVPLVLHGGSGTPLDQLQRSIAGGICKVNVASELSRAFLNTIHAAVEGSGGKVWWTFVLADAKAAVRQVIERWIGELGSAGRIPAA